MENSAAIIEMDVERAKKELIASCQKVDTSLKDVAKWAAYLGDKCRLSNAEIGKLVGKGETWSRRLRTWAASNYTGDLWASGPHSARAPNEPLKTHNNSSPPANGHVAQSMSDKEAGQGDKPMTRKLLSGLALPTEEEADEEYQATLYDQACRFLGEMTGETRRKLFAHIKRKFGNEL